VHRTCFPAFPHDATLADYAAAAAWLSRYPCFEVSGESSSSMLAYDIRSGEARGRRHCLVDGSYPATHADAVE
jgi:hypothetical protein